jgi:hypothetical protein
MPSRRDQRSSLCYSLLSRSCAAALRAVFNTDPEGIRKPQLGASCVGRGVGNGGDSGEAADSLRRWFTQRERALTDPTQW